MRICTERGRTKVLGNDGKTFLPLFGEHGKRLMRVVSKPLFRTDRTATPARHSFVGVLGTRQLHQEIPEDCWYTNESLWWQWCHMNGSYLKLQIDETFRAGLHNRRKHVNILHNLEKVSGQAAVVLPGYWGNKSAPFKLRCGHHLHHGYIVFRREGDIHGPTESWRICWITN